MKDTNLKLANKLKEYREGAFPNMGLRRVEKEVDVDYSHLFRIETGQYVPNDETLLKLTNAYKLTPAQKIEIFTLARVTPEYQKIINEAFDSGIYKKPQEFVDVFYRKNKNK